MAARRIGHVRWKPSRRRWYIDLHYLGQRHYIYSFEGLLFYHDWTANKQDTKSDSGKG